MIDRLLKGTIALILIGMIGLPMLLTFVMQMTNLSMMSDVNSKWEKARTDSKRGNGILTGATVGNLEALEKKLERITAYAGKAKNSMTFLQVLVIDFDDAGDSENADSQFRPIDLDLTGTDDTAVIAIASRPLLWRVATSDAARSVRLGVEGAVPFDIADAPKGLLSGFRIGAFGIHGVAQPEHFSRKQHWDRLCESLERWIAFYGHEERRRMVRITAFTNPRSIKVDAFGPKSETAANRGTPDLEDLCSARNDARKRGGWRAGG